LEEIFDFGENFLIHFLFVDKEAFFDFLLAARR
jgi:hypothetical protein